MTAIATIDDETLGVDDFIRILKLTGQFEGLIDQIVRDKLAVRAAKRQGVQVTAEEIQERADQFRRIRGLHRAADTNRYLDALGVGLDEFEEFITDGLYEEKVMAGVCSDDAVARYFKLHSPRFDSVEVSHILVDEEGKAKELVSYLREDPDSFGEMAQEHSLAETRERGGLIGKVLRGSLKAEVEAKVFNAEAGDLLGPFEVEHGEDGICYEIFAVQAKHPARLDEDVAVEIRRLLREEWLMARAQEHVIEVR